MTYDFRTIAEQYPKSFEKLKEWINKSNYYHFDCLYRNGKIYIHARDGSNDGYIFNPLELTAFFDEQKIEGTVAHATYHMLGEKVNFWFYRLEEESGELLYTGKEFPSRELAQIACWNKSFEILEGKL